MKTIGTRLGTAFLVLCAALVAVGLLGLERLRELSGSLEKVAVERWAGAREAVDGMEGASANTTLLAQLFLEPDATATERVLAKMSANTANNSKLRGGLEGLLRARGG